MGSQAQTGETAWSHEFEMTAEEAVDFADRETMAGAETQRRRVSTTANIDMSTTDFEYAVLAVRELVWREGGFIEHANTSSATYWSLANFNATLRVPAESYDVFLEELRLLGQVNFISEFTEDHTAAYFDASVRLETRRIEQERLLELIEQARHAGEIAEIIELERLLRTVRLEIEGLTRQVDHIDRLVALHTIHLNLFEVEEYGDNIVAAVAFFDRTGTAFADSLSFIVAFSRWAAVFVASIIAPMAVLLVGALLIRIAVKRVRN